MLRDTCSLTHLVANPCHFKDKRQIAWQEWRDSNPRHSVLETDALPTELHSCTGLASEGGRFSVACRSGQAPLCGRCNRFGDAGVGAGLPFGLRVDLSTQQHDIGGYEQP